MELLYKNKVSKSVADIVVRRSEELPIEPDWFMFLANDIESGLNPYSINPYGCFSWIQFCPVFPNGGYKTINGKHYFFSELKNWTPEQLLNLSFDYLKEQQHIYGRFESYHDLYFSILYPAAIGKQDTYVLNTKTNQLFDINKDGKITVGEVKKYLDDRVKLKVPTAYWNTFFKKKTFCSYIRKKSCSGVQLQAA